MTELVPETLATSVPFGAVHPFWTGAAGSRVGDGASGEVYNEWVHEGSHGANGYHGLQARSSVSTRTYAESVADGTAIKAALEADRDDGVAIMFGPGDFDLRQMSPIVLTNKTLVILGTPGRTRFFVNGGFAQFGAGGGIIVKDVQFIGQTISSGGVLGLVNTGYLFDYTDSALLSGAATAIGTTHVENCHFENIDYGFRGSDGILNMSDGEPVYGQRLILRNNTAKNDYLYALSKGWGGFCRFGTFVWRYATIEGNEMEHAQACGIHAGLVRNDGTSLLHEDSRPAHIRTNHVRGIWSFYWPGSTGSYGIHAEGRWNVSFNRVEHVRRVQAIPEFIAPALARQGGTVPTTTGGSNVFAVTSGLSLTGVDKDILLVQFNEANSGAATLAVDGAAAAALKVYAGATTSKTDPAAGDVAVGQTYIVRRDASHYVICNPTVTTPAFSDCEGIYVKAPDALIVGNTIIDCMGEQGCLALKDGGDPLFKLETAKGLDVGGGGVIVEANQFIQTNKRDTDLKRARPIWMQTNNCMVRNNQFRGFAGDCAIRINLSAQESNADNTATPIKSFIAISGNISTKSRFPSFVLNDDYCGVITIAGNTVDRLEGLGFRWLEQKTQKLDRSVVTGNFLNRAGYQQMWLYYTVNTDGLGTLVERSKMIAVKCDNITGTDCDYECNASGTLGATNLLAADGASAAVTSIMGVTNAGTGVAISNGEAGTSQRFGGLATITTGAKSGGGGMLTFSPSTDFEHLNGTFVFNGTHFLHTTFAGDTLLTKVDYHDNLHRDGVPCYSYATMRKQTTAAADADQWYLDVNATGNDEADSPVRGEYTTAGAGTRYRVKADVTLKNNRGVNLINGPFNFDDAATGVSAVGDSTAVADTVRAAYVIDADANLDIWSTKATVRPVLVLPAGVHVQQAYITGTGSSMTLVVVIENRSGSNQNLSAIAGHIKVELENCRISTADTTTGIRLLN